MKEKTNKMFKQSGALPYRVQDGKVEVLLITNSSNQSWVVPKGGIAKGMKPPDSAAKEAWEEAGIIGHVVTNKIGSYKYRKQGRTFIVNLYPLPVEDIVDEYPEAGRRERVWFDAELASNLVKQNSLKRILKRFAKENRE